MQQKGDFWREASFHDRTVSPIAKGVIGEAKGAELPYPDIS